MMCMSRSIFMCSDCKLLQGFRDHGGYSCCRKANLWTIKLYSAYPVTSS